MEYKIMGKYMISQNILFLSQYFFSEITHAGHPARLHISDKGQLAHISGQNHVQGSLLLHNTKLRQISDTYLISCNRSIVQSSLEKLQEVIKSVYLLFLYSLEYFIF